jgi:hypothetical protein
MGVEIILHQHDFVGGREVDVGEIGRAMVESGWRRGIEGGVSRRVTSLPEPLEESDTP